MQNTDHLLMIEPVHFGFNAETAVNNSFQVDANEDVSDKALQEFNELVQLLRKNDIDVTVIKDTPDPATPDSIFPNNWISFHSNGDIFLYPMFAMNRRKERKQHVLDELVKKFDIKNIHDLSHYENGDAFLEGTGSMVLDRDHKIAYACISPRTNQLILDEFCRLNDYTPVLFSAKDMNGTDIYHSNVMMCVADKFVVVCLDSVAEENEKQKLVSSFTGTGKDIIDISLPQLNHFAGNMLQVRNKSNELFLIMSTNAYDALTGVQKARLRKYNTLLHSSLYHIENAGGGSARCMIAEIFNKPK